MREYRDGILFSRKELYEQLKIKTIEQIASEYDLDLVFLKFKIDSSKIPFRSTYDWYRIGRGENVPMEPLKGEVGDLLFVRFTPSKKDERHSEKDSDLNNDPPERNENRMTNQETDYLIEQIRKKIDNKFIIGPLKREKTLYQLFDISPDEEKYEPISTLDLSLPDRITNALLINNIRNLNRLLSLTVQELLVMRNINVYGIAKIIEKCHAHIGSRQQKVGETTTDKYEEVQIKTEIESTSKKERELLVSLILEFFKLNIDGQETALETLRAMNKVARFKAENLTEN